MRDLALLAGMPSEIKGIGKIHHLTLREIAEIGEDKYNQYLSILTFDIGDLIDDIGLSEDDLKEVCSFDFIISNCLSDTDFRKKFIKGLELFFKEDVFFLKLDNYGVFCVEDVENQRFITRDNYEEIKKVIRLHNCLEQKGNKKIKSKQLLDIEEKIRLAKEKINKKLNKKEEGLTLFDLASVLAANGNGLNILNIWDLTIYQFQNQFKMMQWIEEYDIGIRSLLAGADSKNINLKHYIRKN